MAVGVGANPQVPNLMEDVSGLSVFWS